MCEEYRISFIIIIVIDRILLLWLIDWLKIGESTKAFLRGDVSVYESQIYIFRVSHQQHKVCVYFKQNMFRFYSEPSSGFYKKLAQNV